MKSKYSLEMLFLLAIIVNIFADKFYNRLAVSLALVIILIIWCIKK
jgi:hypothetical protein